METKPKETKKNEVCKICGATYPVGSDCPNKKNHENIEKGVTLEKEKLNDIEKIVAIGIAAHEKKYHAEETEKTLEEMTKPELVKILMELGLKLEGYKNKAEVIAAIEEARKNKE